jgi:predicted HTH domain antitoxin
MTSIFKVFNALLPFTNPSTPVWRDILHTIFLCTFLYLAPSLHLERFVDPAWWATRGPPVNSNANEQDAPQRPVGNETEAHIGNEDTQFPRAVDNIPPPQPEQHGTAVEDVPPEFQQPDDFRVPNIPQDHEPEAGPVNGQPARRRDPNREVGAKKARSLARRDQQRAYNEFMREQGEAQRAEWARDAEEREKEMLLEKQRRTAAEAKIIERERKAREEKKEREERERRDEAQAVNKAVASLVDALEEDSAVSVGEVAKLAGRSREWAEQLIRREGVLGTREMDGRIIVTMLTKPGWVVRIDKDAMMEAYKKAGTWNGKGQGKVTYQQLGRTLQETLRDRSKH